MSSPRASTADLPIPDPDDILAAWGTSGAELVRTQWGLVNTSYFVRHGDGEAVLRIYAEDADPGSIQFEHELLLRLDNIRLPFATPSPIPTTDGRSFSEIRTTSGVRSAALFPRLPGDHPDDDDVRGISEAGAALAILDLALERLHDLASSIPVHRGDLWSVHRAVPDAGAARSALGLELADFVVRAADEAAAAYASLPRQLIHDDFALGNVLLQHGRVVGFLDFENAGSAPRAMELAGALRLVLSKGTRDRLWRPFTERYLAELRLSSAELAAVPALIRMREAIVLVWWCGRYLTGSANAKSFDQRRGETLKLRGWLDANGPALAAVLREASDHR